MALAERGGLVGAVLAVELVRQAAALLAAPAGIFLRGRLVLYSDRVAAQVFLAREHRLVIIPAVLWLIADARAPPLGEVTPQCTAIQQV